MLSINSKISIEEKFLISILFKDKNVIDKEIDIDNINYDLLVNIASSHLMLPSLYINLTKKGLIELIPLELKKYLKEIYIINKKRNQLLLNEAKEISEKLNYNKINHVFVKGTSHLFNNIYDDIGERMVGDIDFLVSKEDFVKTIEIIKKLDYNTSNPVIYYSRHYPKLINTKKMFALEVHYELLSREHRKKLNPELILKNKIDYNKVYTPNSKHEILYNIYNFQINNYGSAKLSYSYRSFYDALMITKKFKVSLKKINLDTYTTNYFMIIKELKIPNIGLLKIQINKLNLLRFKLKKSNKLYFNIDNFLVEIFTLRKGQIIKFITNNKYRKKAFKKYMNMC